MHKKRLFFFLALAVPSALVTYAPESLMPKPESEDARLERLLERSPTFAAFKRRASRPCYFIDNRSLRSCEVAYGNDLRERFDRWGTLKVYPNGLILRWSFQKDAWEPDV
ncbi:MAG: hypothetical protein L6R28_12805 [Planctomycetes bacterium]|nr:hypothetical protein [Planctomycetota bacterium]